MQKKNLLSRRGFLKLCGGAVLVLGAGCAFTQTSAIRQTARKIKSIADPKAMDADYVRQLITADSRISRTILWQSSREQPQAAVEYRQKGTSDSFRTDAQNEIFRDDGTTCFLHAAILHDLVPGKDYEYRVTNGQEASNWYDLRTEDGGNFKALLFPDSQSNDYSGWKELAQNAWQRNKDAAFFVNMGDLVDNGEDHTQWNAWLNSVDGIINEIPFVPLMGNHETYDQNWKVRLPEAYLHEFVVPDNKSAQFSRYYYSFDFGPVHFSVLNTQWDETSDFKSGLLDEQLAWLPADVQQSDKPWKIVLMHKDVLQYRIHNRPERTEGISEEGRAFMPLFDKLGINVVFSAHLHTYRNRGQLYDFKPASHGPLYILTGVAGNVRYPNLWIDHAFDKKVAPQPETDNYLTLEASPQRLQIKCFLPNGDEIDRSLLTK